MTHGLVSLALGSLQDEVLRRAGEGVVSFVFSCNVEGNHAKLTAI